MLPESITMRALKHMEEGKDPIEAVKLAFEEEENMLWIAAYGVDMKTGQMKKDVQKELIGKMCERVYNKLNK